MAGSDKALVQGVRAESHLAWAADQVTGTPTILVDGEQVLLGSIETAEDFRAAVEAYGLGRPYGVAPARG